MTRFVELDNLPIHDLHKDLNRVMVERGLSWQRGNQIGMNHIEENSSDISFGVGSLIYDWDASYNVKTETGEEKLVIPERKVKLEDGQFVHLCTQFKGTMFEEVYNELKAQYQIGRVRLMRSTPKTCLSWHVDTSKRIHFPIKTQEGCFMIIEDEVKHLPQSTWWLTDTVLPHTAMNASKADRIHLVVVVLDI